MVFTGHEFIPQEASFELPAVVGRRQKFENFLGCVVYDYLLLFFLDHAANASTSADAQFTRNAAASGIAEVKLGQLALQNASSSEVKAFGQHIFTDRTKANADLNKVAGAQQISLPTFMSDKNQALFDRLSSVLSGPTHPKATNL